MKPGLFQRMDSWIRQMLPFGTTVLLLLVAIMPTRIPGYGGVAPLLAMMGVYYWAIFRPDLLPPLAAFAIGLLYDVMAGGPLGVNALVMLLVQGVTASQRRFFLGKTFLVAWWAFAMVAGGAMAIAWLLVSGLYGQIVEPRAVFFEYLLTVALYPLLGWLLARTQVAVLKGA